MGWQWGATTGRRGGGSATYGLREVGDYDVDGHNAADGHGMHAPLT